MTAILIISVLVFSLILLVDAIRTMFWKGYVIPKAYASVLQSNHHRLRRLLGGMKLYASIVLMIAFICLVTSVMSRNFAKLQVMVAVINALAFLGIAAFNRRLKSLKNEEIDRHGLSVKLLALVNNTLQVLFGSVAAIVLAVAVILKKPWLILVVVLCCLAVFLLRGIAGRGRNAPN